jgi:hypothetical protein
VFEGPLSSIIAFFSSWSIPFFIGNLLAYSYFIIAFAFFL